MYLLNPNGDLYMMFAKINLHSTMYLLNHKIINAVAHEVIRFTFHYVSIKSVIFCVAVVGAGAFTFHYVSIKSNIKKLKRR